MNLALCQCENLEEVAGADVHPVLPLSIVHADKQRRSLHHHLAPFVSQSPLHPQSTSKAGRLASTCLPPRRSSTFDNTFQSYSHATRMRRSISFVRSYTRRYGRQLNHNLSAALTMTQLCTDGTPSFVFVEKLDRQRLQVQVCAAV